MSSSLREIADTINGKPGPVRIEEEASKIICGDMICCKYAVKGNIFPVEKIPLKGKYLVKNTEK